MNKNRQGDEIVQMKILHRIGDLCAEDYGGGAVVITDERVEWEYVDATVGHVQRVRKSYGVEYTYGLDTDHPGEDRYGDEVGKLILEVFQVPLDEPAWDIVSAHGDQVEMWGEIAKTCGQDHDETMALAKSDEPSKIAGALEMYASVYGWRDLDGEPMRLTYAEVEERWEGERSGE